MQDSLQRAMSLPQSNTANIDIGESSLGDYGSSSYVRRYDECSTTMMLVGALKNVFRAGKEKKFTVSV